MANVDVGGVLEQTIFDQKGLFTSYDQRLEVALLPPQQLLLKVITLVPHQMDSL